jgi:hypothetical protein
MHDSVREQFIPFTNRFEGTVPWMYLDVKGLVTVGIGNLIDPVAAALALPFVHKEAGVPASRDDIAREWTNIKSNPTLAQKGHRACEAITDLRLQPDSITELVLAKLDANEQILLQSFPDYESWPADAQLGTLSMAWALGPAFPNTWKNFRAAAQAADFTTCVTQCRIQEAGNPGVIGRNAADRGLFRNAARAATTNANTETLSFSLQTRRSLALDAVDDDTDTDVSYLQTRLTEAGYDVDVNGKFDMATHAAVVAFQSGDQLSADGKVGELTWMSLGT